MRAAVLKSWLNMEMCDIPMPVPGKNEALIKIKLACYNHNRSFEKK